MFQWFLISHRRQAEVQFQSPSLRVSFLGALLVPSVLVWVPLFKSIAWDKSCQGARVRNWRERNKERKSQRVELVTTLNNQSLILPEPFEEVYRMWHTRENFPKKGMGQGGYLPISFHSPLLKVLGLYTSRLHTWGLGRQGRQKARDAQCRGQKLGAYTCAELVATAMG